MRGGCASSPDLALIALACIAALALATWSVQDPSLSHATSKPVRNILGYPGAITADLLMQTFGLGAIMLLLPVSIWGWRMLTHRHFDREALRIAFWILATVLCAGFASCLPRTGTLAAADRPWRRHRRRPAAAARLADRRRRLLHPPGARHRLRRRHHRRPSLIASGWGSREKPVVEDFEEEEEDEEEDDEPSSANRAS